jgi:hypothetical protein
MARKLSRREASLGVILTIVVLGWLWFRSDDPFQGGAAAGELTEIAQLGAAPVVRMDLLAARDVKFDQAGRDLFKYGKKPLSAEDLAALEAQRRAREEAERRAREEAERRRKEAEARAQQQQTQTVNQTSRPTVPRINLKYLGYLGPKDDRIAVFEDGDDVVLGRVGEVVKDDYRIVEIQYGSVVMGFTRPDLENKTQTLNMPGR